MKKLEKNIEKLVARLPFVDDGNAKMKKVVGMTAAITALTLAVIPYEIKVQKGKGVDIKCLVPRVSYEKGVGGNGQKYHQIRIRWFSYD